MVRRGMGGKPRVSGLPAYSSRLMATDNLTRLMNYSSGLPQLVLGGLHQIQKLGHCTPVPSGRVNPEQSFYPCGEF